MIVPLNTNPPCTLQGGERAAVFRFIITFLRQYRRDESDIRATQWHAENQDHNQRECGDESAYSLHVYTSLSFV